MLKFSNIEKPRIDLELYGINSYVQPIDLIRIMDEDTFETFTIEWLYGCKLDNYVSIKKIGGAGDKGRDIIAYYEDGTLDYFQCKHYSKPLSPTNYYLELGKLCYYTFTKEIPIPKQYYIIASNDVGPLLQDLIDKPENLKTSLKENWKNYCENKISKVNKIPLTDELIKHIDNLSFDIIKSYPMANIINEFLDTVYGNLRFGGKKINVPCELTPPDDIESDELIYIKELLEAYSDELHIKINTLEALKSYESYFRNFERQRKSYYSAETIRRFVRDSLTDSTQFEILKDEIYHGLIDTHEMKYSSGYQRLLADLAQATKINTSKCLLDSKFNLIGNEARKGTCHMLVNDGKLKWVIKK